MVGIFFSVRKAICSALACPVLSKIDLKQGIEEFSKLVLKNRISISSISINHLKVYETLPLHHKDPFDRIIIAQSIAENIPVITKDKNFKAYTSNIIW